MRRLAALIGSPVEHSLSPVIHQAAFDAAGVDWTYAAFDVAEGEGVGALDAMRVLGIAGLSVTMPHKREVADAVDRLEPAARGLHLVNTVSWDGRQLVGSSTDGAGFVASLAESGIVVGRCPSRRDRCRWRGSFGGRRARTRGSDDITVPNRTRSTPSPRRRSHGVASVGIAATSVVPTSWSMQRSVGMGRDPLHSTPDDLPCDPSLLRAEQVVVDLVYHPLRTAWSAAAEALGARTVDGLGMLIHQAALQQERWIGFRPDTGVMRTAAEAALADR